MINNINDLLENLFDLSGNINDKINDRSENLFDFSGNINNKINDISENIIDVSGNLNNLINTVTDLSQNLYDLYENVKIPILGMGGAMNGRDAIELMMAGAQTVGIGTAVIQKGTNVFTSGNILDWITFILLPTNIPIFKFCC
jgi:methyl-accepting chemotaxis protein